MGKFCTLLRLTSLQKKLTLEAFFWLAFARFQTKFFPFRKIAPGLGTLSVGTPITPGRTQLALAKQVGQAVRRMAKYTPWQSKCLAQAMAAKRMLKHRGIPTTLYLGLGKDEEQQITAHAWLKYGDLVITGAGAMPSHAEISAFYG